MGNRGEKGRNPIIELERFAASLIVFCYHEGRVFTSGWLLVEFFLILTGYFTAKHFLSRDISDPDVILPYTFRKYKSLFACIFVTMTGISCFNLTSGSLQGLRQVVLYGVFYLGNLLGIIGTGVVPDRYQISPGFNTGHLLYGNMWYIEAMIVMLPVFILLCMKIRKRIGNLLFYFVPLFIHGYLITTFHSLNGWHEPIWLMLDLRALAGLLLGGAVYELSLTLGKVTLSRTRRRLLTLIDYGSLLVILAALTTRDKPLEWLVVGLFIVSLTVEFSGQSLVAWKRSAFCEFLGMMSLPIYCFHGLAGMITSRFFPDVPIPGGVCRLICLMAMSLAFVAAFQAVRRRRAASRADGR